MSQSNVDYVEKTVLKIRQDAEELAKKYNELSQERDFLEIELQKTKQELKRANELLARYDIFYEPAMK